MTNSDSDLLSTSRSILVIGAGELGMPVLRSIAGRAPQEGATVSVMLRESTVTSEAPEKQRDIAELRHEMKRARAATTSQVLVIDTTHQRTTDDGGAWWEVAVPQVSERAGVVDAHRAYLDAKNRQRR